MWNGYVYNKFTLCIGWPVHDAHWAENGAKILIAEHWLKPAKMDLSSYILKLDKCSIFSPVWAMCGGPEMPAMHRHPRLLSQNWELSAVFLISTPLLPFLQRSRDLCSNWAQFVRTKIKLEIVVYVESMAGRPRFITSALAEYTQCCSHFQRCCHHYHVIGLLIVAWLWVVQLDHHQHCWQPVKLWWVLASTGRMAPGPFSGLLAPFMGAARKSKKYEKLQTEDPEKKRQEATQEEINRLNCKIVSSTSTLLKDKSPFGTNL